MSKMNVLRYTSKGEEDLNIILDVDGALSTPDHTYYFKFATYRRVKTELFKTLANTKYTKKTIDYLNYYVFRNFGLYAVPVYQLYHNVWYFELITLESYKKKHLKITYNIDPTPDPDDLSEQEKIQELVKNLKIKDSE